MISVLQVLALDIGTDMLPALALGAERPEPGIMHRSPRTRSARLLDRNVLGRAFGLLGPVEAVLSMAMLPLGAWLFFGWPGHPLPGSGVDKEVLSTMVFGAIVAMQMANAFECRSNPASLFDRTAVEPALSARRRSRRSRCRFVTPPIAGVLGQQPLDAEQWLPILVTPWLLIAAEESRKAIVRRRRGVSRSGPRSSPRSRRGAGAGRAASDPG
jgi:magnesium-transporting ATPase (P-type)